MSHSSCYLYGVTQAGPELCYLAALGVVVVTEVVIVVSE